MGGWISSSAKKIHTDLGSQKEKIQKIDSRQKRFAASTFDLGGSLLCSICLSFLAYSKCFLNPHWELLPSSPLTPPLPLLLVRCYVKPSPPQAEAAALQGLWLRLCSPSALPSLRRPAGFPGGDAKGKVLPSQSGCPEKGPLRKRSRANSRKAASPWGSLQILTNGGKAFPQGGGVETSVKAWSGDAPEPRGAVWKESGSQLDGHSSHGSQGADSPSWSYRPQKGG